MQTVCLYSPFPTRATLVGAPPLCATCARRGGCTISSPLPRGVCATPPRCANGECRAAHKGTPSPFRPCPPLRSNRTGSAGPPAAPPFITPPFMHKRGLVRAPTGHENAGARHSPPPLACRSPKRVWHTNRGWTTAPFLLLPCPRERGAENAAPQSGKGPGAQGGTARMGGGTQLARQAPLPPFACGNALPPFAMPPCAYNGAAPEGMRTGGAPKGSGRPHALRVRTTPRAFRVHDPCAPPFVCHARWTAKGGVQGSGVRDDVWGRAHTPFPAMREWAATQKQRAPSAPPSPPQMGVRRRRGAETVSTRTVPLFPRPMHPLCAE